MGNRIPFRIVPGVGFPQRFIVRMGWTVPFIEAVIRGPAPIGIADMPFTSTQSGIAGLGEDVAKGPFLGDQSAALAG